MKRSANFGSPGGPEPPRALFASWEKMVPVFLIGFLVIAVLVVLVGPTGKTKESIKQIKGQDKGKLDQVPLWNKAKEKILAAKPAGKKWNEMTDEDMAALVSRVSVEGLSKDDIRKLANEIQREKRTDEQVLPSDDPKERWKQLTGTKFENIRRIDLKDETGSLNSPQVDVFEDEGKGKSAGQMNHDEWVVILESKGAMAKIQRRKDKKEGWIEVKYLKEVYSKDDIAKGPDPYKPKEKDPADDRDSKGGKDEWD